MNNLINCLIVDDEPMAREILENHLGKIDSISLVGSCKNAIEAFNMLNTHPIDLIFLDINMPEKDGFELLEMLDEVPITVFTTAYDEYAIKSFEYNALDYLLKPMIQY